MTSTNKRYELLKDLPYVKAGAVYEWDGDGTYVCDSSTALFKKGVKWDGLGKEAVENNPEWFREIIQPNWEIQEFKTKFLGSNDVIFSRGKDGVFRTGLNGGTYDYTEKRLLQESEAKIFSVRRLSDGETMSIGDVTNHGRITGFRIGNENTMFAEFENGLRIAAFLGLKKLPTPTTPTTFQWTDEKVIEFSTKWLNDRVAWAVMYDFAAAPSPIQIELKEFKENYSASKQLSKEEEKGGIEKLEKDLNEWEKICFQTKPSTNNTERIEVRGLNLQFYPDHKIDSYWSYELTTNKEITENKLSQIKSAIENVINGSSTLFEAHQEALEQMSKMFTEEDLRKAFESGRRRVGEGWNDVIGNWKFETFEDYKKQQQ